MANFDNFIQFDPDTLSKRFDESGNIAFQGFALSITDQESEPKWLIKRISKVGQDFNVEWASKKFDQIWDDRASLFATAPFVNQLSTTFDGVNDRLTMPGTGSIGSAVDFERTVPFSQSCWIKTSDVSGGLKAIMGKHTPATTFRGYDVTMSAGQVFVFFRSSFSPSNELIMNTTTTVNDGAWHNIIVTYDGSSAPAGVHIYIDGVDETLVTFANTLSATIRNTQDYAIGARGATATTGVNFFLGNVDEAAILDIELTSLQATEIFNLGDPFNLNAGSFSANLTAYYRMGDGDVFPNIFDNSAVGNGLDGDMINMTADDFVGEVP